MLVSTPIQRSTASFAQAHTGAASIFRNELNACFFKGCYELLGGFNTATTYPLIPGARSLARIPPTPLIDRLERFKFLGGVSTLFRETHQAHVDHERAKNELKGLMPEDAKEAMGHGIRAKRSKSGAVSFDLVEMEASHASVQ
jgi:hypothetical protein